MRVEIFHRFMLCLVLWFLGGCAERTAYRYLDAAVEHEQHREHDAALEAFRAAVETRPGDPYLRRQLGRAYLRREMYEEGVAELEQVLQMEPSYAEAYRDLAMAFQAQQMPGAAAGWLCSSLRWGLMPTLAAFGVARRAPVRPQRLRLDLKARSARGAFDEHKYLRHTTMGGLQSRV